MIKALAVLVLIGLIVAVFAKLLDEFIDEDHFQW